MCVCVSGWVGDWMGGWASVHVNKVDIININQSIYTWTKECLHQRPRLLISHQ